MSLIIFGATGFLGRNLMDYYKKKRQNPIGTYYKHNVPGLVKFDLRNPSLDTLNVDLKKIKYAIITSAITDMDLCKTNWDNSYEINVSGIKKLITLLNERDIIPIYISSDYVYDGEKGNYDEEDKMDPTMAYGKQKKEVEDFLTAQNKDFMILRLAKIYSHDFNDNTIITSIIQNLKKGETLKFATDQIFSPNFVGDVCGVIDGLIEKKSTGCYNISCGQPISRYDLAKKIQSELNISSGSIVPCLLEDLKFDDKRPKNTSMNNKKVIYKTGFKFTTIDESIKLLKKLN